MGLVMAGRAAFVFPLSFLSNLAKKSPTERIGFKQQVCYLFIRCNKFLLPYKSNCITVLHFQIIIWWSGLMRGAVSMALAYNKVNCGKFRFL